MLTQLTDILTTFITNLYVTTGLIGIVLAMAIESCCIPLPSEIVMPLAGAMVASGKLLSGVNLWLGLVLVALAGATGCLLGSIAAYGIGYSGGRSLMLKYGRYVLISQHDADKADRFFQRWGSETAFFSRLLPVIRTYISLPAGIARMPFAKFCVYTFLGSFPWCLLLAYAGTLVYKNIATLGPIFHAFDVVIVVLLIVLVALYIWRHIRNDRRARAALAAAEEAARLAALQQQHARMQQPQLQQSPRQQGQWQPPQQGQFQQQPWGQQPPQPQPSPWRQGQPQSPSPQQWGVQSPPQQQPWPPRGGDENLSGRR